MYWTSAWRNLSLWLTSKHIDLQHVTVNKKIVMEWYEMNENIQTLFFYLWLFFKDPPRTLNEKFTQKREIQLL